MTGTLLDPSPALRASFDRFALRLTWALVIGVLGVSVTARWLGIEAGPALRYGPLLLSIVLFGLPHGAVDHLVPVRLAETPIRRSLGLVGLGYLVLGGLYLILWLVAPLTAAMSFIAVTWFHWGQGDVHALLAFVEAPHLDSRPRRVGTLIVRGGLPMLVPLIGFPGRYQTVLGEWLALFVGDVSLTWALAPVNRILIGAGFLLVTVVVLATGYRSNGWTRGWRVDAGETVLLWAFFLLVPPLVAIGVYFTLWHSLRHIFRIVGFDSAAAPPRMRFRQLAFDAVPLTVFSMVLLGALWFLVPISPTDLPGLMALYLVFIAVLTLPHVVVVSWMDRRESVWGSQTRAQDAKS